MKIKEVLSILRFNIKEVPFCCISDVRGCNSYNSEVETSWKYNTRFVSKGPMQNFTALGQLLLREKYVSQKRKEKKRKERRKIIPRAQGQHMHFARTEIDKMNCQLSTDTLIGEINLI